MKNLTPTATPAEAHDTIMGLWQTEEFIRSPYVREWTRRAARRRPIFFEYTDSDLEWAHFTSYLGCVALREYDNPAIQDLYYLHELIHVAEMPYTPGIDFYSWRTDTLRNELTASLHSEVYAYFEMDGLRRLTFPHQIWADRFLDRDAWQAFYRDNPRFAQERLRRERKLVSTNPNPHDFIEQQIAGYFQTNIAWAEIWREIYTEIVEHMAAYTEGRISFADHRLWICSKYEANIPFYAQAVAFNEVYQRNKRVLGNQKLQNNGGS